MTTMLLSRLHYPIRNLGYGVRAGIWFQGCSVRCRGCVSRDTWTFDDAHRTDTGAVLDWLDTIDGPIDGVTISGGEPTDQPEALQALLNALAPRRNDIDILLFTGRTNEYLHHRLPWLRHGVDLLITDPFRAATADNSALRGSSNQRVHRLSLLAERRYPENSFESDYADQRNQIAVHVDDRSIWMVGIPRAGDLQHVERSLGGRGISVDGASWLT